MRAALDQPIVDLFCQGKHFFILLANNVTIHAHMMMSGRWLDSYEPGAQFRLTFQHISDSELTKIFYHNKRFGFFEVLPNDDALIKVLEKLAPDFLGRNRITEETWLERFNQSSARKNLRNLLMDQDGIVSGVGNYVLAEVYYRSRLNWKTKVGDLDETKRRELYFITKNFIEGMYNGTERKVVYKQKFDPLGNPVVPVKMTDNRTFWSVPALQGPN